MASIKNADRTPVSIGPRAMREIDAAAYCGFSGSYFRNLRVADMRRRGRREPITGPRWINVGTAVRYMVEDLDAWLDSHRTDPAQADPRETGL
jgi:hypothetical protein